MDASHFLYASRVTGGGPEDATHGEDRADPGTFLTPMIDVVFQLIVFFLLSLRFRSVDQRIESELPRRQGVVEAPPFAPPDEALRVTVRRERPDQAGGHTRVTIGRAAAIDLPAEWPAGGLAGAETRATGLEQARRRIEDAVRAVLAAAGPAAPARAEIRTAGFAGGMVPHGDVLTVLDALVAAGMEEVGFRGTALPHPSAAR